MTASMTEEAVGLPLAGTLRVVYFLALAGVVFVLLSSGVTEAYRDPTEDEGRSLEQSIQGDPYDPFAFRTWVLHSVGVMNRYERNMGVILTLVGTAVAVIGIVALPARFNAMRAGLLGGGTGVFFAGMGYATGGANSWLSLIWAVVAFVALLASFSWLEAGSEAYARLPLPARFRR